MGKRGKRVKGTPKEKEVLDLLRRYSVSYTASHFGLSESEVRKIRREAKAQEQADRSREELAPLLTELTARHHRAMLDLVGRWKDELGLSLGNHPLRDLRGSRAHWDKRGTLVWQVCEDGSVRLAYPLELDSDMETELVRGHLHEHLHFSRYSWLLDDEQVGMPKWKKVGGQELEKRAELLKEIDGAVLGKRGLFPKERPEAGLIDTMSDPILASAVDGVYGGLEYVLTKNAQVGLFEVRYGPFLIALVTSRQKAQQYREWHRHLMATFKEHSLVGEIADLKNQREALAKAMQKGLTELILAGYIPGRCRGCPS